MSQTILVVDDDTKTAELVSLYLQKEGFQVVTAYDGSEAIRLVRARQPDLVVLDWMLPLVDGPDVCRILRSESHIPIIMLTAKTTEEDTLYGLDLGADDYMTKPFSPREVVARVRAVLRRTREDLSKTPSEVRFGELDIDFVRHEARLNGTAIRLTPKEFKLLETLAREPGRAFTRLELLNRVFGSDYEGIDRTVDVHVMNLRKKLEADPAQPTYIQTVYGIGYKFAEADHAP